MRYAIFLIVCLLASTGHAGGLWSSGGTSQGSVYSNPVSPAKREAEPNSCQACGPREDQNIAPPVATIPVPEPMFTGHGSSSSFSMNKQEALGLARDPAMRAYIEENSVGDTVIFRKNPPPMDEKHSRILPVFPQQNIEIPGADMDVKFECTTGDCED